MSNVVVNTKVYTVVVATTPSSSVTVQAPQSTVVIDNARVGPAGPTGIVNTQIAYVWSNTQTFIQTVTFNEIINGTSNNSNFLNGNSATDLRSYSVAVAANAYSNAIAYANIVSNTAYSNAISYVDNKSFVNTSQLSSNLNNYALLSGSSFTGNVTANNISVNNNLTVSGNVILTNSTLKNRSVGVTIDGSGSVITVGNKGYVSVPFSGIITAVTSVTDVVGSLQFDIWKRNSNIPTSNHSITNANYISINNLQYAAINTFSGWSNTTVQTGDVFAFNVISANIVSRATLSITIAI